MPSVGFVGTYPPTRCGIATFTAALRRSMSLPVSGVVASVDREADRVRHEVAALLVAGSRASLARAAAMLNRWDVALIQHEFGIYGGPDGSEVVELVRALHVPILVVLHTALRAPTSNQRAIVEELTARAELVVVQSDAARQCLHAAHEVDGSRVRVVPHGATINVADAPRPPLGGRGPLILTWGLLGPSKGIEFGLEALARLRDLDPRPRYLVLGETHPHVSEREGESYRQALLRRTRELGLEPMVEFDARYLETRSVLARVRAADVVLLPYRSHDQVVSGVLVEAIASGKPVIATAFPHARELLGQGSGILVPHDDADAIAAALRRVLGDSDLRARMAASARAQAAEFDWSAVGRRYRQLVATIARRGGEGRG